MTGILTRKGILERIKNEKIIENYDIKQCLAPASYEMRVGNYYDWDTSKHEELREGQMIAAAPAGFILIGTLEKINMPNDVIGLMYLRSTYARRGFTPWFMGIVDPGYEGTLTVAMHNLTNGLIPIYGAERICHLIFEELPEPVEKGYEGVYQRSTGATPAKSVSTVKVVGRVVGKGLAERAPTVAIAELLRHLLASQ